MTIQIDIDIYMYQLHIYTLMLVIYRSKMIYLLGEYPECQLVR